MTEQINDPTSMPAPVPNPVQTPVRKKDKPTGVIYLLVTIIVVLLGVVAFLVYQNSKENELLSQRPAVQKTSMTPSPTAAAANVDSTDPRVTKALAYGAQTSDTLTISSGSAKVTSALYATQFGATAYVYGETGFVNVTITNNTSTEQTYDLSNFSLQLPDGIVKQFSTTNGSDQQNPDPTITIASGGSAADVLVFESIPATQATQGTGYLIFTSPEDGKETKVSIKFKKPWLYTD